MKEVEPFTKWSSILKWKQLLLLPCTTQTLPRATVFLNVRITFNYRFLFSNLVPRGSTWDLNLRDSSGKIIFWT